MAESLTKFPIIAPIKSEGIEIKMFTRCANSSDDQLLHDLVMESQAPIAQ
jgi:hypothetical protein